MSVQTLQELTGLAADAPLEAVEKRFLELVKTRIQAVASSFDESLVAAEDEKIRAMHRLFFDHALGWAASQMKERKGRKDTDHPDAAKLRLAARNVVDTLQNNMIEFALCYMHLNRYMTLLREEMRQDEDKYSILSIGHTKWTADTGVMINRNRASQKLLMAQNVRLESARPALEQIEKLMDSIRSRLIESAGQEAAESLMLSLVASIRTADFTRARKVAAEKLTRVKPAVAEIVRPLIETALLLAESQAENLRGPENKLVLRPLEADVIIAGNVRELHKIRGFMGKYHMPYLQYRLENLFYLKDKLMVVGSLESLMTLYIRLLRGLALPMPDIRTVRAYESDVLGHITFLTGGQFQEVPLIESRARDVVAEFRAGRRDYQEMAALDIPDEAPQVAAASN